MALNYIIICSSCYTMAWDPTSSSLNETFAWFRNSSKYTYAESSFYWKSSQEFILYLTLLPIWLIYS